MTNGTFRELDELFENEVISAGKCASCDERAKFLKNAQIAQGLRADDMKLEIENEKIQIQNKELSIREKEMETRIELEKEKIQIQNKELSIREKEMEIEKEKIKSQNRKDICLAVVTGVVKLAGVAACAITAAAFVGSSMQMTYQENMIPPKSLGEGLKFMSSIGSKLI